jgi:hypothetical protein
MAHLLPPRRKTTLLVTKSCAFSGTVGRYPRYVGVVVSGQRVHVGLGKNSMLELDDGKVCFPLVEGWMHSYDDGTTAS